MTRLVIARHGQALCNVERTIEGVATCRGLSPLGVRQAAALAARLVREGFRPDVCLASPIARARATADVVGEALSIDVIDDADLEELRPGEAEGLTWDQYRAYFGSTEGWDPDVPFAPGAESWRRFADRVSGALDRVAQQHEGSTVLIVAHGGVVDASLFHYFGLDPTVTSPIDFETANTSLTEWERRVARLPGDDERARWRLCRYNDAAHLDGIAAPPPGEGAAPPPGEGAAPPPGEGAAPPRP